MHDQMSSNPSNTLSAGDDNHAEQYEYKTAGPELKTAGMEISRRALGVDDQTENKKRVTCMYWVKGQCTEGMCPYAHHTFPSIVENGDANPHKLKTYEHWLRTRERSEKGCWWPEEMCGFAHEPGSQGDTSLEVLRERRTKIQQLANARPLEVKLQFVCNKCRKGFEDQGSVAEHCKVCAFGVRDDDLLSFQSAHSRVQSLSSRLSKQKRMQGESWR